MEESIILYAKIRQSKTGRWYVTILGIDYSEHASAKEAAESAREVNKNCIGMSPIEVRQTYYLGCL